MVVLDFATLDLGDRSMRFRRAVAADVWAIVVFLPGVARAGATRMKIETVRVSAGLRGQGAGGAMIR